MGEGMYKEEHLKHLPLALPLHSGKRGLAWKDVGEKTQLLHCPKSLLMVTSLEAGLGKEAGR